MTTAYDSITCPMPDCGDPLLIDFVATYGLTVGDLADVEALPQPGDAYTTGWRVTCADGHVILLPGLHGCPCPVHCTDGSHDGMFDESEDDRTFREHDRGRLIALIDRLNPTR